MALLLQLALWECGDTGFSMILLSLCAIFTGAPLSFFVMSIAIPRLDTEENSQIQNELKNDIVEDGLK